MCWNTIEKNWASAVARLQPTAARAVGKPSDISLPHRKDEPVVPSSVPFTTTSAGWLIT